MSEAQLLVGAFILPLLATVVIEISVAFLMGAWRIRSMAAVALINVATNPPFVLLVALIVRGFGTASYLRSPAFWVVVALAEVVIVFVEWRLLMWALHAPSSRAARLSMTMNAASLGASLLAYWLFVSNAVAQ